MSSAAIILVGALAVFVAAFTAAVICFRGRPIPNTRLCRKCSFNLQGIAATCPECGSNIAASTTTRPARHRRTKLGASFAGLAIVAACISLILGASAAFKNGTNPYKPLWLLLLESSQPNATGAAAIRELQARDASGKLSEQARRRILEAALAARKDESRRFDPLWADVIGTHRTEGRVSDTDWLDFVRRGVKVDARFRAKWHHGSSTPLSITVTSPELPRIGGHSIRLSYTVESVTIAGEPIPGFGRSPFQSDVSPLGSAGVTMQVRPATAIGQTHAEIRLKFTLLNGPNGHEIGTWTDNTRQPVEIVAADAIIIPTTPEPALAASIRACLTIRAQRGTLYIDCKSSPRQLAFEVFARIPNAGPEPSPLIPLGSIHFASQNSHSSFGISLDPVPQDARTAEIVLRPSRAAAEASTTLTEYWSGEDIVFPDITVR
ncbi:MAG TPA: hypothetical protein VF777_12135 [Phycisphaerales bacterium]